MNSIVPPRSPQGDETPRELSPRPALRWSGVASIAIAAIAVPLLCAAQVPQSEYAVEAPLASRSLLLDGAAAGDLMVVVGERGHVLLSHDQGLSWRQARVPTRATLTGVFLYNDKLGWAVGHDAVILRTTDGGQSWDRLHYAPEQERPLLDVWFHDAEHGFAIGAYGFFLKTADSGTTWTDFAIGGAGEEAEAEDYYYYEDDLVGADRHLNHLSRSATGRLYVAAEAGTIYRSDDDGESWTVLPSPYGGTFFATLPLAGDALLVFGLRGHLYRSEDAGESWQEVETGTEEMLTDGRVLGDGTVIIVGVGGTVLRSRDGGRTFELEQQPGREAISAVLEGADGGLILIGEHGLRKLNR